MAIPVAVQIYSVRADAAEDFRGTLEKIKEMGYDGVEFAGLYGYTPAEIKKMCEEIGLIPLSAHVPYVDMVADARGVLSQYAEIGCRYVAVPYLLPEHRPDGGNFAEVVKNVAMIGEVAKALQMHLLYHNHDFEFVKIDGKYALDILYDTVPAELLGTELDTCWVSVGGENPAAYIRKYAGRTPVVHLKDYAGEKSEDMYELIGIDKGAPRRPSKFEFRPVGYGVQDFPGIIQAAVESGAEWLVVEQDVATMGKTPMESIRMSRDYLRSLGY